METVLLIGDLNRHLGSKVPGNNEKVSTAGKLLLNLLEKGDLTLVNATDKVVNGPFTRFDVKDPKNDQKKSVLDLVIISTCLVKYVDKLVIDSNLQWTPYQSSNGKTKHPDHYALLLSLKDIAMKKKNK